MEKEKQSKSTKSEPNYLLGAVGYCCIAAMLLTYVFCARKENSKNVSTYVVTDKGAQKIAYTSIENANDVHVMEFGAFDTDSLLYKNINVGDTIVGSKSRLDKPIVPASCDQIGYLSLYGADDYSHTRDYPIYTVNRKTLREIREKHMRDSVIAKRDSILHVMKQKQR